MTLQDELNRLNADLKAALNKETMLNNELKLLREKEKNKDKLPWKERVALPVRGRILASKLKHIKKEQQQIADLLSGKRIQMPSVLKSKVDTVMNGVDAFHKAAAVGKILVTLASPHAQVPLPQPDKPGWEEMHESQEKSKGSQSSNSQKRSNSKNEKPKDDKGSGKEEQSKDEKKAKIEELIKAYQKDVRKNYVATKDIKKSLEIADKELLKKVSPGNYQTNSDLKKEIKIKYGEDAAKAIEEARKLELKKREKLQNEKTRITDRNRGF